MFKNLAIWIAALILAATARAQLPPAPPGFRTLEVPTGGTTLHVRGGRQASAEVLLHGYADMGAMHAGFAQFAAFDQDAIDNIAFLAQGKLDMPLLAIGGEKSYRTEMAKDVRFAANHVQGAVIPRAGRWIMEENPRAAMQVITDFLAAKE